MWKIEWPENDDLAQKLATKEQEYNVLLDGALEMRKKLVQERERHAAQVRAMHKFAEDLKDRLAESQEETARLKVSVGELTSALDWMVRNRALTIFIEEEEHVQSFFKDAIEVLEKLRVEP